MIDDSPFVYEKGYFFVCEALNDGYHSTMKRKRADRVFHIMKLPNWHPIPFPI
jgi:hypothetical protein